MTAVMLVAALTCMPRAEATLTIEPVFNCVAGSGQGDKNFPVYDPGFLIGGVAFFTADEPGAVVTYAAGDPRDPCLDAFHVWNNTQHTITGFPLRLIGTATDTENPGSVMRGRVDAVWGDGDGDIGSSDIFANITVSTDGKGIRFENGSNPVGSPRLAANLSPNPTHSRWLAWAFSCSACTAPADHGETSSCLPMGVGVCLSR